MSQPVDKARKRKAILRRAITNNVPLNGQVLSEVVNSNMNRDLKLEGFSNLSLNPMDYLNDEDVTKADIIKAEVRRIKAQNAQEASKTPNRELLKKWEAETLLQQEKARIGRVR